MSLKWFLPVLFFISQNAVAKEFIPSEAPPFSCKPQLNRFLSKIFKDSPAWQRVVDANSETKVFRASARTGEWHELRLSAKKTPLVVSLSSQKTVEHSWNIACQPRTKNLPALALFQKEGQAEPFTDENLHDILKSGKKGVFYIWSPNMTYSVTEFRRFRDVAKKRGLEFIPLLDHQASMASAAAASQKVGVDFTGRKLASMDLYMRNATLHFPTVFVFANGKIHERRIVGVMTSEGFDQALTEWLRELQ